MNELFAIKTSLNKDDIKEFRNINKLSRRELAFLLNVSIKTIDNWEISDKQISGPVVLLMTILKEKPELINKYRLPAKECPIRMYYMSGYSISTVIDVDMLRRKIKFKNYTDNILLRAFGTKEDVDYKDYEEFLESRCFPSSRDKLKLELRNLEIDYYDPLAIIRKTEGRMAEDDCYIVIERNI